MTMTCETCGTKCLNYATAINHLEKYHLVWSDNIHEDVKGLQIQRELNMKDN
jgi:hypothetical protein